VLIYISLVYFIKLFIILELQVCICVCGWIWSEFDFKDTWKGIYDLSSNMEMYSLRWEPNELQAVGRHFISTAAAGVVTHLAQRVAMKTALASTLSALALPMSTLQLSGLIGHPWNVAFNRAKKCGKLLASALQKYALGKRPITLCGFSLGARLIFHCLEELANCNAKGIIENAYILGAPVCTDKLRWSRIRKIVSGRLVNGYTVNDWILTAHKTIRMEDSLAGLQKIKCNGVENVDLTSSIPGHLTYRKNVIKALEECNWKKYYKESEI